MLTKIVYAYFSVLDWLHIYSRGCSKGHDFEYIVTQYEEKIMFFKHCTRCKYTEGMIDSGETLI